MAILGNLSKTIGGVMNSKMERKKLFDWAELIALVHLMARKNLGPLQFNSFCKAVATVALRNLDDKGIKAVFKEFKSNIE